MQVTTIRQAAVQSVVVSTTYSSIRRAFVQVYDLRTHKSKHILTDHLHQQTHLLWDKRKILATTRHSLGHRLISVAFCSGDGMVRVGVAHTHT